MRGNPPKLMKKINSRPEDLNMVSLGRALSKVNKIQKSQSVNHVVSYKMKSSF
jgi:hypothetical protein